MNHEIVDWAALTKLVKGITPEDGKWHDVTIRLMSSSEPSVLLVDAVEVWVDNDMADSRKTG